ncbi:DUF7619 domain-containing protein [Psychroserpens ponticola]|uniref:T9SS type A sorting domain-containing protein n=1 Tax=Psychroserpens ponticola TaxID=2932268 RepID=A0ABY7S0C3_9FLAO|nr:T9SS type A sorting domain-containing protein [Psychroserpens ponticola]WCO02614.1 T9SS type A sorting domain-containing protein [Psychroserpens ponticola]
MKSFLLSFLFLITFLIGNAQIIDIPDANFKNGLLNYVPVIDTNSDGEIQISEAELITELYFQDIEYINSLEGLESFVNLIDFTMGNINNYSTTLIIENLPNLTSVNFFSSVSSIALINLPNLKELAMGNTNSQYYSFEELISNCNCVDLEVLILDYNHITSIDVSSFVNLEYFVCSHNYELTSLDVSQNINLTTLDLSLSEGLQYLNIKNGSAENLIIDEYHSALEYICVDDDEVAYVRNLVENSGLTNCFVNSYCTFNSGGVTYALEGGSLLDIDTNGCDINDIQFPNMMFNISNNTNSGSFIANASGDYSFALPDGVHTLVPQIENPDYFSISPTSLVVDFPTDASPYNQDFCVISNGTFNDLEVVIVPVSQVIPGFDSHYKIIYKNKGNTLISGSVEFDYSLNADVVQFLSATPTNDSETNNILSWNFTDLSPFETRGIEVSFNLNTPTDPDFPLNSGDDLGYVANIFPLIDDETPSDNEFELKQIVVNSYDPNDIRCLEGEIIAPEEVGKYVHYLIRFENLGTANAINVVVNNRIDATKFDINTLVPLNGSHDYYTRINPDNDVEFIFENIQLPFDDANNDGYVVYKIKTLSTLVLGDEFANQAEIYFDFNAPVITNAYITEVAEDNLSTSDFSLSTIKVYPNPVADILTIEAEFEINTLHVYDIEGRRVLENYKSNSNQISMSSLETGIYFVKVFSDSKIKTLKVIKN